MTLCPCVCRWKEKKQTMLFILFQISQSPMQFNLAKAARAKAARAKAARAKAAR